MNPVKRPSTIALGVLGLAVVAFWLGATELFGRTEPNEAGALVSMLVGFSLTFVAAVVLREEM